MRLALLLCMGLLLTSCITEQSGLPLPQANYPEAARANAMLAAEYARQGKNDLALDKIQRALEQDSSLRMP